MEWQPIETAPVGQEILVYSKAYGCAKASLWRNGIYEVSTYMTCCRDYYDDVTHWMPLPDPPVT